MEWRQTLVCYEDTIWPSDQVDWKTGQGWFCKTYIDDEQIWLEVIYH